MAKKRKIKIEIENLPKKDEQLSEEELKKVSGGGPKKPGSPSGPINPDIDCWEGKPKI